MTKEECLNSLEAHYNNPELRNIRGDVHLIASTGTKGELLAKNVTPAKAWKIAQEWASKFRCGG